MKRFLLLLLVLALGVIITGCDFDDATNSSLAEPGEVRIVNDANEPVIFWMGASKNNNIPTAKREIYMGNTLLMMNREKTEINTVLKIGTQKSGTKRQYMVPVKMPASITPGIKFRLTLVYDGSGFRAASGN